MKICNRTYYGDVGKTYQLNLHKPREERLPFLCHLTFTANGHSHGELVQKQHITNRECRDIEVQCLLIDRSFLLRRMTGGIGEAPYVLKVVASLHIQACYLCLL
ncbi:hypothetical protein J6590_100194 [Homalodisca vitripennis]|nr:hypothetical protein J6590_100194 [Homalodisca vitripennis]